MGDARGVEEGARAQGGGCPPAPAGGRQSPPAQSNARAHSYDAFLGGASVRQGAWPKMHRRWPGSLEQSGGEKIPRCISSVRDAISLALLASRAVSRGG